MSGHGLRLAARCLLDQLETFSSTQLAGHGMTALPLVSACVLEGDGRYTGLGVRKERKRYLSGRRIEGTLDLRRPVVVIDDSLSSGTALHDAIAALESEGAEVEGAVALVGFPGRGGLEWATARGYRVETLLEIGADLGMSLHTAPDPLPPLPAATNVALPDGLAPAVLARRVAEHVLRFGTVPTPPTWLDQPYDPRGGVFVSFRRRSDDHRLARDGFWHFEPDVSSPPRDVVEATVRTLRTSCPAIRLDELPSLKIAVTFLGPLESIVPAQLDFERYAIVVRDLDGTRAGGALPNTQVFTSEVEQYRHARERNARIAPGEAHVLLRQEVHKTVEPGERWPAYGAADPEEFAWARDPTVGDALTAYASNVLAHETGAAVPLDSAIPSRFEAVAVTLYRGRTVGSGIAWGRNGVAGLIREAVERARNSAAGSLNDVTVGVSVLHEPEQLGLCAAAYAATKIRKGLDALRCNSAEHSATLLPGALVYNGWSKKQFVAVAASLAGVSPSRPGSFTTYQVASWVRDRRGCRRLSSGFPVRGASSRSTSRPRFATSWDSHSGTHPRRGFRCTTWTSSRTVGLLKGPVRASFTPFSESIEPGSSSANKPGAARPLVRSPPISRNPAPVLAVSRSARAGRSPTRSRSLRWAVRSPRGRRTRL